VPRKILAFEQFLKRYPEWMGKVVLAHVDEPPLPELETEVRRRLHKEIHELTGRINGELGSLDWTPIQYSNQVLGVAVPALRCRTASSSRASLLTTPLRLPCDRKRRRCSALRMGVWWRRCGRA
jgi:trehalose-6-phosphate synthase